MNMIIISERNRNAIIEYFSEAAVKERRDKAHAEGRDIFGDDALVGVPAAASELIYDVHSDIGRGVLHGDSGAAECDGEPRQLQRA